MKNINEIRERLLQSSAMISPDIDLFQQLDALTIYTVKNLSMKNFYDCLWKIISREELNSFDFLEKPIFKLLLLKYQQITKWLIQTWNTSIQEASIEKLIICFLIAKIISLNPLENFIWTTNPKIEAELQKHLIKVNIDLSTDEANYPNYSAKKYISDYTNAIKANDLKGIFTFIQDSKATILHSTENIAYYSTLVIIAAKIKSSLISGYLANKTPIMQTIVFENIPLVMVLEILEQYNSNDVLPLLFGFKKIATEFNEEEHTLYMSFVERNIAIIEKISTLIKLDSLFSLLITALHLYKSEFFNDVYTAFVAKNTDYIDDFVNNLDFYNGYGSSSSYFFMEFGDESSFQETSTKLYNKFILNLQQKEYLSHPFSYSTYITYFLHAIKFICNDSYEGYLLEIEKRSTELVRCLYSWRPWEYKIFFTDLIYWILASKQFSNPIPINYKQNVNTYRIFNDARIMNLLVTEIESKEITFENLHKFLEEPENNYPLIVPIANDEFATLSWEKFDK